MGRADRLTEEQTLFHRILLVMSTGLREITKEVLIDNFSTLQDLFVKKDLNNSESF